MDIVKDQAKCLLLSHLRLRLLLELKEDGNTIFLL